MQASRAAPPKHIDQKTNKLVASEGREDGWAAVPWSWDCVLVVCFEKSSLGDQLPDSTLLVNPSAQGLSLLDEIDANIESISLFFPPIKFDATPRTEAVQRIIPFAGDHPKSERRFELHCASGCVFLASENELQQLESRNLWSVGAKFKVAA